MDYKEYKQLSKEQRINLITQAKPEEKYRRSIAIEGLSFSEENWIDLFVVETISRWFSTTVNRIRLQTYREKSKLKQIKGLVMIFHGMTSHTNEGAYVAKRLSENGYQVVGFDQRGFGKSEGTRGYIKDFATIFQDSSQFVKLVREQYPKEKLFILGLSLGGLTSYSLALHNPQEIQGCILMAPALKTFHGSAAYFFAKTLSILLPNTQVPKFGRAGKRGSKNPNSSQLRKSDPHRFRDSPYIRTLSSTLEGIRQHETTFSSFKCPLLITQGGKDNTLDPMGAIDLYEQCVSSDKQILFYENMWHNVWQEEEIHQIMDYVVQWLKQRT